MGKKIKKEVNFLELVPKKTVKYNWEVTDSGLVQIIIPRNGIIEKIIRPLFKTPKIMRIDLDTFGSFVWNSIDGNRNIEEIGDMLKMEFGKKIEPIYERLGKYVNILRNNKFITLEMAGNQDDR